ncbi:MAG: acylphosphatase [Lachnospiraceae bacterium]|nr:acylphosphatase [Lachnospiraceae bacterium]
MTDENVRWRLTVSGDVQAVGFRYRAKYSAQTLGLCGWVKNEWDGTVVMEVQGTPSIIRQMLDMIEDSDYIHITHVRYEEIPLEAEGGFHIR